STDLQNWWLYTSALTTNGQFDFSYLPPEGGSARFFRARVDSPLPALTVTPQADPNLLDTNLITPEDGGAVSLTDTNGVTYTLTLPTNAVVSPDIFELSVITNLSGLPLSGSNLAAVLLAPADAQLWRPAELRISFPTNRPIDWTQLTGYAFSENGSFLRLSPF